MLETFVITYINNILIYSPSHESHVKQVKQVLAHVLENQLYVKGQKFDFSVSTDSTPSWATSLTRRV